MICSLVGFTFGGYSFVTLPYHGSARVSKTQNPPPAGPKAPCKFPSMTYQDAERRDQYLGRYFRPCLQCRVRLYKLFAPLMRLISIVAWAGAIVKALDVNKVQSLAKIFCRRDDTFICPIKLYGLGASHCIINAFLDCLCRSVTDDIHLHINVILNLLEKVDILVKGVF